MIAQYLSKFFPIMYLLVVGGLEEIRYSEISSITGLWLDESACCVDDCTNMEMRVRAMSRMSGLCLGLCG